MSKPIDKIRQMTVGQKLTVRTNTNRPLLTIKRTDSGYTEYSAAQEEWVSIEIERLKKEVVGIA